MRRFLLACGLSLFALAGYADTAAPVAADPVLEERVMALSHKLRCLVCQNQSIAESDADLAVDLRTQVREQLSAGKSEDEIADYMVARYGDFVLYEPPMRASTLLLWLGPIVLAVVGIGVLMVRLARRNKESAPALDEAQRARARALLEKDDNNGTQA
ncbi:MAG: cytochrome c-type biogenesis protein CcmH [Proteobacteria bacterium]|nr:MAG: cytochrome c-type biogenesis protein CcmH [Pseudomonadota bacterium]